jgi:hypothetical protein
MALQSSLRSSATVCKSKIASQASIAAGAAALPTGVAARRNSIERNDKKQARFKA